MLSSFIPADERIVTIEDAAELQLHQEHVLRLESRPPNIEGKGEITIRDLVRNALRMRPDRIVVGEVRDGAALDMLQAMNTGHDGSLTTVHANTPARLAGPPGDHGAHGRHGPAGAGDPRAGRQRGRPGRSSWPGCATAPAASPTSPRSSGMEGDIDHLQDLFVFDFRAGLDQYGRHLGALRSTGLRPRFVDQLTDHGIYLQPEVFGMGGGV